MFHWDSDPLRLRRTISRRDSLRVGMLGLGGLALPDLLRLRSRSAVAGQQGNAVSKETSVILLFVHGGPSQLETYDLKPEAPTEIRGPFLPITTAVPGIDICEHLPKQAKLADKFTLIRSCCHDAIAPHLRNPRLHSVVLLLVIDPHLRAMPLGRRRSV